MSENHRCVCTFRSAPEDEGPSAAAAAATVGESGDIEETGDEMPRLGHYTEKYELNGPDPQGDGAAPRGSYGSFPRDEHGALLGNDPLGPSAFIHSEMFGGY
ncbi:hypothetical protein IscW_ISCW009609 [Ixodes scapularis]|uniref:Uncharacterized protein n=1 Tax=Ixodes scapularis TaxID=6945 RepID=B7Q117_IXOSC|nr:hypothetical protein IscW_ISCW009609 [Ixodes scapularis]|eukprot:XP_002408798.1 hypothetical protein IscW_ISCW009609 [Ixodes scapularis]